MKQYSTIFYSLAAGAMLVAGTWWWCNRTAETVISTPETSQEAIPAQPLLDSVTTTTQQQPTAPINPELPPETNKKTQKQAAIADQRLGFSSLKNEVCNKELVVTGFIPEWLSGTLFRTGPALFESKGSTAKSWFDGCAMLYRFGFCQGSVTYSNKFLRNDYWQQVTTTGTWGMNNKPKGSFFARMGSLFSSSTPTYDNGNMGICCIDGTLCAITETPLYTTFNKNSLTTGEHMVFDDNLEAHYACAHGLVDEATGDFYSYLTQFGNTSTYVVYKIPANSTTRIPVAKVSASYPAYMHSFAMTQRYLILIEPPFRVNPLDLIMSDKGFFETFTWKPQQDTKLTVIDKQHGAIVGTYTAQGLFFLHQLNAYEDGKSLVIDIAAYQDPSILFSFKRNDLLRAERRPLAKAYPTRITVPLSGKKATVRRLSAQSIEMPRVNYRNNRTRPYTFVYGTHIPDTASTVTALIKTDVQTGVSVLWQEENCIPGEAIFVARPGATREDDGVLIATVLDLTTGSSFVLILNAQTMQEQARAYAPHHIPFDSHGYFCHN